VKNNPKRGRAFSGAVYDNAGREKSEINIGKRNFWSSKNDFLCKKTLF
jgi:hypothetical protein